jgi:hypothetical protein
VRGEKSIGQRICRRLSLLIVSPQFKDPIPSRGMFVRPEATTEPRLEFSTRRSRIPRYAMLPHRDYDGRTSGSMAQGGTYSCAAGGNPALAV